MPSALRRLRVPLVALAAPLGVWLIRFGLDQTGWFVEALFPLNMAFQISLVVSLGVVLGWFFVTSGYPRRSQLIGGGVMLALLAVGFGTIRSVEFDGQMTPRPVFRWEPSAAERLADYQAQAQRAADGADLRVAPTDSPAFRGRAGTGHTPDLTPPQALEVRWRHPTGSGHGGVAVAGNSVVTIEQRGTDEAVVCYDRATGAERWVHRYPARFSTTEPMGGDGPRTTPTIHAGDVISLGALGDLFRLDGQTGVPKWQVNILSDAETAPPTWAISGSPLVVGNRVIVNPGGTKTAVAAYYVDSGARAWAAGRHPAAYASPVRLILDGIPQIVVFDADGLGAHDPTTGAELWRFPWKSDMGMNSAQPIAVGPNRLFVSSEKSNGGAVLEVRFGETGWQVRPVWQSRALAARFTSPVLVRDHIYGLTDGRLVCVELATGRRVWAEGNYGNGQILVSNDTLFIMAESGAVAVVAANPTEHIELLRVPVFEARTWNMPALVGPPDQPTLFVRNHREIACVAGRGASASASGN